MLTVVAGNIVSVILPVEVTEVLPVLDVNVVTLLRVEVSVTVVVGSLAEGPKDWCNGDSTNSRNSRFEFGTGFTSGGCNDRTSNCTTKDAISFKDASSNGTTCKNQQHP